MFEQQHRPDHQAVFINIGFGTAKTARRNATHIELMRARIYESNRFAVVEDWADKASVIDMITNTVRIVAQQYVTRL